MEIDVFGVEGTMYTVGRNKTAIKKYIENQLKEDEISEQMTLKEYIDQFTIEPGQSKQINKLPDEGSSL